MYSLHTYSPYTYSKTPTRPHILELTYSIRGLKSEWVWTSRCEERE
jgi:hypothetical protein